MRGMLVSCLIGLYLYAYQFNISNIGIAAAALLILVALYQMSIKKGIKPQAALIALMCYTLPISWRDIFGGSFASLPIPWFYLIGAVYVLSLLLSKTTEVKKAQKIGLQICIFSLIILCTIQLGRSININDAFKEYTTLMFYFIILLFSVKYSQMFSQKDFDHVIKAYILTGFIAALYIILQFISSYYFNITIGKLYLAGNNRLGFCLMFDDLSGCSIYLATAILMAFSKIKTDKKCIVICISILFGLTISSARTGFVALILTALIFAVTRRGVLNKTVILSACAIAAVIGLIVYSIVRPYDSSLNSFFDDTGRFETYRAAFNLFIQNPFMGVGLGDVTLILLLGITSPHFSLFKILTQTGIIFTFLFTFVIFYTIWISYKEGRKMEMWVLILSMIGSCFIPGLFNGRFFTILISLVYLKQTNNIQKELVL